MGLKEKRKPHKEKNKRKRGKKFKYDPEKDIQNNKHQEKYNPFEAFSQKKFQKKNNSFAQLISEYQSKNIVNSFKDKRIAENSNLSYDEKMKLRYKAQQMLKKTKNSKFAFDNDDDNSNDDHIKLTHKGKEINDINDLSDADDNNDNDDEYYEKMNEFIENMGGEGGKKLSKQEKFKAIIQNSKKLKEEKQRIKEDTLNKIEYLNDNFEELNSMLKKRKRTFNRLNDDYDKMTSNFIYSEKTHPTDRIKTKEEIEQEKEKKLKKMEIERLKEEVDEEDDSYESEKKDDLDLNEKHLTKKERIEKLIQERLGKAQKKKDKEKNELLNKQSIKLNEDEEGDDLSDLNELEQNGEEDENEDEGDYENDEDNEDDNDNEGGDEDDDNEEEKEYEENEEDE